jgi:hypothetical protein
MGRALFQSAYSQAINRDQWSGRLISASRIKIRSFPL